MRQSATCAANPGQCLQLPHPVERLRGSSCVYGEVAACDQPASETCAIPNAASQIHIRSVFSERSQDMIVWQLEGVTDAIGAAGDSIPAAYLQSVEAIAWDRVALRTVP